MIKNCDTENYSELTVLVGEFELKRVYFAIRIPVFVEYIVVREVTTHGLAMIYEMLVIVESYIIITDMLNKWGGYPACTTSNF